MPEIVKKFFEDFLQLVCLKKLRHKKLSLETVIRTAF